MLRRQVKMPPVSLTAQEFTRPDIRPSAAIVLLTHLASELLKVAMSTWVLDATYLGFDVMLLVSAPPTQVSKFNIKSPLPARVTLANTYSRVNISDSHFIERWKVKTFFSTHEWLTHEWTVFMDDDTLPNLPALMSFLCSTKDTAPHGPVYMGWFPHSTLGQLQGQWYATGQAFLMNRRGLHATRQVMSNLSLVRTRQACHSASELAGQPSWWAGCCAVSDGVVTSSDAFIGDCLAKVHRNVSRLSLGDHITGLWGLLFHHGGHLKRPEFLQQHYDDVRRVGWTSAFQITKQRQWKMHGHRQLQRSSNISV